MGHTDSSPSEPIPSSTANVQRRQRRGKTIRSNSWHVRASDDEARVIKRKAVAAGVTVPRLLVSLGVGSTVRSSVERKVTVAALMGLRRQLAGVGTNLNQLSHHANALGELPEVDRLGEALASVEELRVQLESVLDEVK